MLDGPAGAIGRGAWAARVGGVLSSEGAACLLACLSSLFFCFEGGRAQAQRGIRPLGGSPACRFDQLVCGLVGSKSYGTYLARPLFPAFMPGISHGRVWYGMVWCGALLCGCSFMRFPAPAAFQRKKNRMSIQGWMGGWVGGYFSRCGNVSKQALKHRANRRLLGWARTPTFSRARRGRMREALMAATISTCMYTLVGLFGLFSWLGFWLRFFAVVASTSLAEALYGSWRAGHRLGVFHGYESATAYFG